MKVLNVLLLRLRLAWWRRAEASLTARNPSHPDLPFVVLQVARLEDDLEREWRR